MRIFKTLNLVPEKVNLLTTIGCDFLNWRWLIHTLAVFEDWYKKFLCCIVIKHFCFPNCIRIENCSRLWIVNNLIINAKLIGNSLTAVLVKIAVNLFEVRICNLGCIFADLDFRHNFTAVIFNGNKLINTAEYRRTWWSDKSFTDTECVNLSALHHKVTNKVLVKSVWRSNCTFCKTCVIKHFSCFLWKIGNIARVKADCTLGLTLRKKNLLEHLNGIRDTAL